SYLNSSAEKNNEFIAEHTEGFDAAILEAQQNAGDIEKVSVFCGLDKDDVEKFYRLFARTERVVTVFSQGINQWSNGTDRVNSIINCHLITGRIGRPGMGPFSFTGQPNAMGGREVGGLSNQLAAHMAIENEEHQGLVQQFWQSPYIAKHEGLKAVDLFKAVHEGKIKALWIMATNPAVSLPDSEFVREALEKCEFVVVSDCVRETDTTKYADVLLPGQTWGERDGTVTNSERRITRQRSFLPKPGDAKPDWWIVSEVAKRMGFADSFKYDEPRDIFMEHAALSGHENNGQRDFDISMFKDISYKAYDDLEPVQWPVNKKSPDGTARMFTDAQFFTASKKAQFITVKAQTPASGLSENYPLVLNSGRIRDQWHTMTRTGKSATLSAHIIEPFAEIHPDDAARLKIENDSLVKVSSQVSSIIVRAQVSDDQQKGNVFVPMHWNNQFASKACVDSLVASNCDPVSGQPEFKHTPVKVETYNAKWYGFLLSRRKLEIENATYWVSSKGHGLWRYELAGEESAESWADCARQLLCTKSDDVNWVEYFDQGSQRYRAARIENNHLESCIFIGPDLNLPERDWLAKLFESDQLEESDRISLLTGKPADPKADAGHVICACFGVGINTIKQAVIDNKLTTTEEIGELLKAGTNCGSCVPELKKIIQEC
ncbi:MAG: molybdopterin-dependent oxidoreductase, partial [Gammaproteobacteria bacterium]|nr:molybdopterin-dependent oxidoreductase [Gammaproteobacteria bacterium]